MAEKYRFQNPVVNDTINLQLFAYNSNNRSDFFSVEKVEIYYLDPTEKTAENTDGRRLISTTTDITHTETGLYQISILAEDPLYVIGNYLDVWYVVPEENESLSSVIENTWQIYPDLWYTTTIPIIYDFNFNFYPNKIRKGSKKYITIDITPNVPNTSDLNRYYENIAIVSPLKISIEQSDCGNCVPVESDLRLIVDEDDVEIREKCKGFYFIDTSDLDSGIYNVWFNMEFGESTFISDTMQLQIYE